MSFTSDAIAKKNLPPLMRREDMLDALARYMYGFTPPAPKTVFSRVLASQEGDYAGKADTRRVEISFETGRGAFAFSADVTLPRAVKRPPVFVHISFLPDASNKLTPVEEIIDGGFGIVSFCYRDIVNDRSYGNFSDGLGRLFVGANPRMPSQWGKIGMWAYAASRVMDYIETQSEMDAARVAVIGHSRLGKTALWCGAQDERFFCTIPNDSGAGGATMLRGKKGEHIFDIVDNGRWDWFCEALKQYIDREEALPVDQHMLIACVAPRLVCVGSAEGDDDPALEFLTCAAASEAYERAGVSGLIAPDRPPVPGEAFHEGHIGCHLRAGAHFQGREDWRRYMAFMRLHMGDRPV